MIYAKAFVSGALGALGQISAGLIGDGITKQVIGLAIGAFVAGFGLVYATPNSTQ